MIASVTFRFFGIQDYRRHVFHRHDCGRSSGLRWLTFPHHAVTNFRVSKIPFISIMSERFTWRNELRIFQNPWWNPYNANDDEQKFQIFSFFYFHCWPVLVQQRVVRTRSRQYERTTLVPCSYSQWPDDSSRRAKSKAHTLDQWGFVCWSQCMV